jgi:hypothetical protein
MCDFQGGQMKFRYITQSLAIVLVGALALACSRREPEITTVEARAIAKEAYIYGFPLVDSYRIQHAYFVNRDNPEFKGAWNRIHSLARVATPEDKAVQTPNSDTPYSLLGLDLRTEPMVLTVPEFEKERYYSIQLIDAFTHNFAYIGSRATGNEAGSFLIAGPRWDGTAPKGVKQVIRSESELVFALYRTQLFNPADLEKVKEIQARYQVESLSAFLGQPAPAAGSAIDFPRPLTPAEQKSSLQFFDLLNFILGLAPTVPSEKDLMARFAKIGVGAGRTFDADTLSPQMKAAIEQGMADAWGELAMLQNKIDSKEVLFGDMFGTREFLKNNYLYRMAAAVNGIYGNSKQEAMYPIYSIDAEGEKLDGSRRYALRFAPGQMPPVNAFWSLTMYELPASLLVANPLNRYLLNSPMLPQFKKDADGGLTLLIQNESPGKDKESNWLPAPKGPFVMFMRLYWPQEAAIAGQWTPPTLMRGS